MTNVLPFPKPNKPDLYEYSFTYKHNGRTCHFKVMAEDYDDAEEHLFSIAHTAEVDII